MCVEKPLSASPSQFAVENRAFKVSFMQIMDSYFAFLRIRNFVHLLGEF